MPGGGRNENFEQQFDLRKNDVIPVMLKPRRLRLLNCDGPFAICQLIKTTTGFYNYDDNPMSDDEQAHAP
jgi:hypothetical protein